MFGAPGDAAVDDDVTAACRWSALHDVIAPPLLESAGTASLVRLPAAIAAEALGMAAGLAWRRLLLGAAEGGAPILAALNEVREVNAFGSTSCACQREYRWGWPLPGLGPNGVALEHATLLTWCSVLFASQPSSYKQ
jgi:hypothetical protein